MRVELRNLQRQLGLMFIHVTHDQEEALSVADRIVVMHEGRIAQVGDPLTISTRPENEIVARFMGDNNIFRGNVVAREGDRLVIDAGRLKVAARAPAGFEPGSEAAASVRAAGLRVDQERGSGDGINELECEVEFVEYLGDLVKLHLRLDENVFVAKVPGDEYAMLRGREGSTVRISWQEADVQLLRP
jgi:ABC-type Fe3+/spermidine/putrescine transport system ATPase subunit